MCHVDALSKSQVVDFAVEKLPKFPQCLWFIREEVGAIVRVLGDLDGAVSDPIVEPVGADLETFGELVGPQVAGNHVGMGQVLVVQDAAVSADGRYHADQNDRASR